MFLCISVRFPGGVYHGRQDGSEPEWPPSPLRLFQALVASATTGGGCGLPDGTAAALRWLERAPPPTIVAPVAIKGGGYVLSVPNNAMDIVARAWSRGAVSTSGDANPATHRTMKRVRPVYVDEQPVHFLWRVPTDAVGHAETIAGLARKIVVLGVGIDLVVVDGAVIAESQTAAQRGTRWIPQATRSTAGLRVPVAGTLSDVLSRHSRFLHRVGSNCFDAPPPLTVFASVAYDVETAHVPPPAAVFALLDARRNRLRSFEPTTDGLTVAGMTRHAVRSAAERSRWPDGRIDQVVLGHAEARGDVHRPVQGARFAYVPLPSIEPRDAGEIVGRVRRVMITLLGSERRDEITWARGTLAGQPLVAERNGIEMALLGALRAKDAVTARYVSESSRWTSVTPLVLPGYDDPAHYRRRLRRGTDAGEQTLLLAKIDQRTDALIRKAILQAGFSAELARHAEIEWRRVGFLAGCYPADHYGVPDHLRRFTRLHVRIAWRDPAGRPVSVRGPCLLGGGRFYGLGLLAPSLDI